LSDACFVKAYAAEIDSHAAASVRGAGGYGGSEGGVEEEVMAKRPNRGLGRPGNTYAQVSAQS
jgi:hypothetical protein